VKSLRIDNGKQNGKRQDGALDDDRCGEQQGLGGPFFGIDKSLIEHK
jgi:hypothetical protein